MTVTPGAPIWDDTSDSAWASGRRLLCASARACDQASPPPVPLAKRDDETNPQWQKRLTNEQKDELRAWQKAHRWHPHQLRHNAATELRREFGLEAARIILGHNSTTVPEIYAEKDEQEAVEAIMKVG